MTNAVLEKENSVLQGNSTDQFLKEIRRYPLLTAQEELELGKRSAQGDEEAVRTLVSCNLRLVVSIAMKYADKGVPLLDLIQEGTIGLQIAARSFDYTRNNRFVTHAYDWIRQSVNRCVLNNGLVHVPLHTREKMQKAMAVRSKLLAQQGTEPTAAQIAEACGFSQEKTEQLLGEIPQVCSLDSPAGESGEDTLGVLLPDTQTAQPYTLVASQELKELLERLLSMLSPRQQQILRLHFGMEDGICHSLQEIADMLEISKERARQIERQAIDKLKELGKSLGLEDFLE